MDGLSCLGAIIILCALALAIISWDDEPATESHPKD